MDDFGKNLKELRIAAGISQAELANQLYIAEKTIQRYEKGGKKPDREILVEIASYFNVSTDYLLGTKSYKELIKERKEKLRGAEGYNELYSHYLKCLNNYEIVEEATYYWIYMEEGYMGGQTEWIGWADDKRTQEIRRLRPVKPREAIELCTRAIGKPMVINHIEDALVFLIYGGQAIVRKDICEKYLSSFFEDYIGPSPELKVFEEI